MNYYYAQINKDNMVFSVFESTKELDDPTDNFIELDSYNTSLLGSFYVDGQFIKREPDKIISRLQLIEKLGDVYYNIVASSKTDVEIEIWLEKFRLTETFNLSNLSTNEMFSVLLNKNLITQEKINQIVSE